VVYDAHELFCDLEYLPSVYRAAWRAIADQFVPLASVVITVSDPIAELLRDEHRAQRTVVLPNHALPGNPPRARIRQVLGLSEHTPLAVHIGNVGPTRNPQAALDLLFDFPDIHVAFVGATNTNTARELQALAAARGVADRLHLVPAVSQSELTGFIQDADLSVILYTANAARNLELAMPNKLFDSLAAGLPVIAADGTAAAEFVERRRLGRAFDPGRVGDLAASARALLADGMTTSRAREHRHEFFWTSVEPILASLMEELAPPAPVAVL
jgi:glycosyltransferase involved in cell wall biosynthesis